MLHSMLDSLFCDGVLAGSLASSFPRGLPHRLLVLGSGGTGKTVLCKQILVASCQARLQNKACAAVPFRVALTELVQSLSDYGDVWAPVYKCFARSHGTSSV